MPNDMFLDNLTHTLKERGFGKNNTLVATSLCCDEVNRELEKGLKKTFGDNFSMGGLAGFAFGGVTSFCAMAHHIPTNGNCLVIFGPHVGVDADGVVGKVNRRGRAHSGACCGSAAAAASYVSSVRKGVSKVSDNPTDPLDAQQTYVGNMLLPYGTRLALAIDPAVELPISLYDAQKALIDKIVSKGCGEVGGDGKIALLGGIQINTPPGTPDYFLPMSFELLDNKGNKLANMIGTLRMNRSNEDLYALIALGMFAATLFYVM
jgi:hypothetical protein